METLPPLTQRVFAYVRQQRMIQAGDRVCAAVSGGADSVALLRILLELRPEIGFVLSVAHLNHQLRDEESDGDERFVQALSREYKLEFHGECAGVGQHAEEQHLSLEAAGRELRYSYFRRILEQGIANKIATAHTLDDQAETVLLRLVRGAGTRGLAGIYPRVSVAIPVASDNSQSGACIVRPLLGTSRKDVEAYLSEVRQSWREDRSNQDVRHARNRVRHGLMPWLQENLNPSIRNTLAETAEVARAEEEYWERQIASLVLQPNGNLDVSALRALPLAVQRRLIRSLGSTFGSHLEFRHVEQVLQLVNDGSARGPLTVCRWNVKKIAGKLIFAPQCPAETPVSDFEYFLAVPGDVIVEEIQCEFRATLVPAVAVAGYNPQDLEDLMDARLLAQKLVVRNWREGDRFWPAHTKAPRKIKQLLQERHVTGRERECWPVVVSGDEVVWMRGFPSPSHLRLKPEGGSAVRIQEIALTGNL